MITNRQVPSSKQAVRGRTLSRRLNAALCLIVVLAILSGYVALWWVDTLPSRVDEQQTVVVGRTHFAPDSDGSVRVVVQDLARGEPIAGARVKVSMEPGDGSTVLLDEGVTDASGSLPVSFHVPSGMSGDATLVVETESAAGSDRVEQTVTFERDYRLLLSSDKPVYQPGQTIHMRALALSTFDLTPARGETIDFLVEDPRGNKVYRKSVKDSEFGIAAADFVLADMVNQGSYNLSVSLGDVSSEKTVDVRPYALPKFGVSVSTDRGFYLPGQRVEGVVQADYFFGKPVVDAEVHVVGSVWDVERTVVVDLMGQTDEDGTYEFGFDLPEFFAGSGLDSGQAQFALEVTVIDQTDHPEQTSQVLPIAAQPLIIEAVAESGVLKPGVENVVYILVSYPDGRPAAATLRVGAGGQEWVELPTGEFGLVEFTHTPDRGERYSLIVNARDETGLEATRQVIFGIDGGEDSVLLRADRAAYVVGETMNLTALTPVEYGDIYLDIVRAGQTLSTRSAKVVNGKAEFAVDASPDLFGTLELHAYKVLLDGTIVRDTRVVLVDPGTAVAINVSADKDTYLPGETASVEFRTTDAQGGLRTALGVAVVDESVFALQQQDPGFAKLYFMLEQELLEPFYQVDGFEMPAAISPSDQDIRATQDSAAKAAWVGVSVPGDQPTNSRPEKLARIAEEQEQGVASISRHASTGLALIPLALGAVVVISAVRSGVVKRSLQRLLIACVIILLGGGLVASWLMAVPFYISEVIAVLLAAVDQRLAT